MNTKHIIIAAAAVATLFTGCTKNIIEKKDNQNALKNLELAAVSSRETKAALDGAEFPLDGEIGLFLFEGEDATKAYGTGCENIKYSYDSGKKKWTADPAIKVGGETGYLYGYYPYSGTATNIKAIPVSSSLNEDDVMYATKQTVTSQNADQATITMNHALARVAITVKNNGYIGSAKLSSIKFEDAKIAVNGTLDATSGNITATKADEVTLSVPEATQTITKEGTVYECLLIPSVKDENKQDVTLTLTIDGQVKTVTLKDGNGVIIAQNTKSNITLTLSNTGLSVSSVSIDDWNVVEVGGHKVTVKRSNEDGIANDVFLDVTSDGSSVTIKALAATGRFSNCTCTPAGKASYTPSIDTETGICTFTISDVQEDITAEVGYYKCQVCVNFDSSKGSVKLNGSSVTSGTETSVYAGVNRLASESKSGFRFLRWSDADKSREVSHSGSFNLAVKSDTTLTAEFCYADAIPGLFTVNNSGKKVLFSKGNLWCGTDNNPQNSDFHFEANQYDTTPSSDGDRVSGHISHFMWCNTAEKAMALQYDNTWNADSTFFAAKNFTVNGYSGWGVLTGGGNGEWAYLLNTRMTIYGKDTGVENRRYAAVKVNGMAGLLIFPDDFSSWPSEAGDEPQTFNTYSNNWNDRNYTVAEFTTLQNNGCVFLPAAGSRSGFNGNADVKNVSDNGHYWSASPFNDSLAYFWNFGSGFVYPLNYDFRGWAQSVRLVTECQ